MDYIHTSAPGPDLLKGLAPLVPHEPKSLTIPKLFAFEFYRAIIWEMGLNKVKKQRQALTVKVVNQEAKNTFFRRPFLQV